MAKLSQEIEVMQPIYWGLLGSDVYCLAWILIIHMLNVLLCFKIFQALDMFILFQYCLNVLFSSTAEKNVVVNNFYTNFQYLAKIHSVNFFRTQFRAPLFSYTKCLNGWPYELVWNLWIHNSKMYPSVDARLFVSKLYL